MRRIAVLIAAAALIACGQPATNASADSAPPPPRTDDMIEGGGEGGGQAIETQAAFVARCTRELIAANPESQRWAGDQCAQQWQAVVAAGPWAEAFLAVAPASGERVAAAQVRTRVTQVRWNARPDGTLVAQGRLGNADAQVETNGNFSLMWSAVGEMSPYDVIEALRGRGAEVTMLGCSQLGAGEFNKAYRVTATGRAPFQLSLYDRGAPTANASSFYNATIVTSGQVQTLAQLRADGSDWAASCPY
ncbi:hypothetical protein U91I_00674 [alpha proteobacterium U9-1i]|nr:hypothetical protein U91I_00674 [alpha proteobacterium U9-1i]